MQIYNRFTKNHMILSCHPFQAEDVAELFETNATNVIYKNSLPGRGQVQFIQKLNHYFVSRHYKRGGFIRYFLKDNYLYFSKEHTRAWRELHLLAHLFQSGFPVPTPVACRVQCRGLFYSADLIMLEIANARPLSQLLLKHSLSEQVWQEIGNVIQRFHQAGVYHADLNAHNILIDTQQKIWLIDFDRGSIKKPRKYWQNRNLKRLKHSLIKLHQEKGIYFFDEDWVSLMRGYTNCNSAASHSQ